MAAIELEVKRAIDAKAQYVKDKLNNSSILSISNHQVGIGTEKPVGTLSVVSSGKGASVLTLHPIEKRSNQIVRFQEEAHGGGNMSLHNSAGDVKVLLSGADSKGYIDNGQNFGIGTTDPTTELDVKGEIRGTHIEITDCSRAIMNGVPPSGKAPDQSRLRTIMIDLKTWQLYYNMTE